MNESSLYTERVVAEQHLQLGRHIGGKSSTNRTPPMFGCDLPPAQEYYEDGQHRAEVEGASRPPFN